MQTAETSPDQSVCRGFIFAIAHVRGGGDLGQYWHLDGRLGNKPNTFKDTVAAATHLIKVSGCLPAMLIWNLLNLGSRQTWGLSSPRITSNAYSALQEHPPGRSRQGRRKFQNLGICLGSLIFNPVCGPGRALGHKSLAHRQVCWPLQQSMEACE